MVVPESPLMRYFGVILILCLLILSSAGTATAQATTNKTELVALNTILGRWGKSANSNWNISGEPCSGWAIDSTDLDNNQEFNPGIKCDCSYNSNKTCHIVKLKVYSLDVVGSIPDELQNLTYLSNLQLAQNYLTGPVPAFIGNMTPMQYLSIGINALSGPIPKELGNLRNLISLGMGINNFSGSIPDEFGNLTNLQQLYIDSLGLSGELPKTLSNLKNMKILSKIPVDSSFAIRCGGARSLTAQDTTVYQSDNVNLSAASYYVTGITFLPVGTFIYVPVMHKDFNKYSSLILTYSDYTNS
ncbi:putative LRR receptor-like serine/threonine-protein kinase [Carex littledalei]|uniref:Putative LRR receptor-like serine/threonine-protein kinase n=1 Tax=Carex littledalei TaxID=544730 RepID=A0A833VJ92_9POAL|nr:putative LRR receptor-like serine/threonine-protein kinase [Carex littledalei]